MRARRVFSALLAACMLHGAPGVGCYSALAAMATASPVPSAVGTPGLGAAGASVPQSLARPGALSGFGPAGIQAPGVLPSLMTPLPATRAPLSAAGASPVEGSLSLEPSAARAVAQSRIPAAATPASAASLAQPGGAVASAGAQASPSRAAPLGMGRPVVEAASGGLRRVAARLTDLNGGMPSSLRLGKAGLADAKVEAGLLFDGVAAASARGAEPVAAAFRGLRSASPAGLSPARAGVESGARAASAEKLHGARSGSVRMSAVVSRVVPEMGSFYLDAGDTRYVADFGMIKIAGKSYRGEYPHEMKLRPGLEVSIEVAGGYVTRVDLPQPRFSRLGALVRDLRTWHLGRQAMSMRKIPAGLLEAMSLAASQRLGIVDDGLAGRAASTVLGGLTAVGLATAAGMGGATLLAFVPGLVNAQNWLIVAWALGGAILAVQGLVRLSKSLVAIARSAVQGALSMGVAEPAARGPQKPSFPAGRMIRDDSALPLLAAAIAAGLALALLLAQAGDPISALEALSVLPLLPLLGMMDDGDSAYVDRLMGRVLLVGLGGATLLAIFPGLTGFQAWMFIAFGLGLAWLLVEFLANVAQLAWMYVTRR